MPDRPLNYESNAATPPTAEDVVHTCPKCNGPMHAGFIVDRGHGGHIGEPQWMAGRPVKSFWTGIKLDRKQLKQVITYRCGQCGLLESYAY